MPAAVDLAHLARYTGGDAALNAEILRLFDEKKVTYAFLVPALILFVLQHPRAARTDFSSLKNISYGASPISDEPVESAQAP